MDKNAKAKGTQSIWINCKLLVQNVLEDMVYGVQNKINAPEWFLNNKEDCMFIFLLRRNGKRQFHIQGLKLD